jgi:mono/diheme cytochrome c family protein
MLTSRTRPLVLAAILLNLAALAVAADPLAGGAPPGDPRAGEALYVGQRALENHGAPCLACHGVAGHGLSRAASFGPDLTGAHASFGDDGLDEALSEVPFPSMQPIYAAHAITPAERRDLVAFLAESARREPPRLGPGYPLGAAAAAGAFLLLFVAIGRRRARRPSPSPSRGATP